MNVKISFQDEINDWTDSTEWTHESMFGFRVDPGDLPAAIDDFTSTRSAPISVECLIFKFQADNERSRLKDSPGYDASFAFRYTDFELYLWLDAAGERGQCPQTLYCLFGLLRAQRFYTKGLLLTPSGTFGTYRRIGVWAALGSTPLSGETGFDELFQRCTEAENVHSLAEGEFRAMEIWKTLDFVQADEERYDQYGDTRQQREATERERHMQNRGAADEAQRLTCKGRYKAYSILVVQTVEQKSHGGITTMLTSSAGGGDPGQT